MKTRKIGVVLLALLLAGMAMVPIVSATEDSHDEKIKKWQDEHTIKVTKTVSSTYADGVLTVETSFTGKELTKGFGIDVFTHRNQMKISAEDAKKMNLVSEKKESSTSEISGVFTAANDLPLASRSGYPIWLYAYSNGVYYQTGDPINMIWAGAYVSTIKTEMLEKGWYDNIWEETLYISDGTWKAGDGLATSTTGPFGRDHVRLFQLNTGQVAGAAHKDSWPPHYAVEFEQAEDRISVFYQNVDDTMWHVYSDNISLGNSVSSPYSNGYAAYIGYW
jgi:hypothetical protein